MRIATPSEVNLNPVIDAGELNAFQSTQQIGH
jgi:hypothetical protein